MAFRKNEGLSVVKSENGPPDGLASPAITSQSSFKHRRATTDRRPAPNGSALVSNGGVGRRLLNVGEAAQYLGLEIATVYKKARLRELPYVKVGRALRFDVEALGRFIEEHTVEIID
jgi:excisionase family DNA binding protein